MTHLYILVLVYCLTLHKKISCWMVYCWLCKQNITW